MLSRRLSILLTALFATSSLSADIESVTLKINGILCPHCLPIVNQSLQKVDFVDQVTIHPRTGLTRISMKKGKELKLSDLSEAVKAAGYRLGKIQAEIVGEVIEGEEHFLFKSRGDHTRFLLYTHEWEQGELVPTVKGELKEELDRYNSDSKYRRIEGQLHFHVGQLAGLSVERIWSVEDDEEDTASLELESPSSIEHS